MRARVGDRLVLEGTHPGDGYRVGVVTKVVHADGRPPYYVRWLEDGHVSVVFPGAQARIQPAAIGGATAG
ncbi:hypothetical protein BJY16_006203 [Actinoplanes octamycinicus]|uniref:DUF1918 domain-containing protein n=1 Tax=Actinoplanes octamycinicus TaxID=135948 RepID=A0A7W7MA71_9ACTN|nr:DUF1918 domain-containing protein [Actinoplanes octamycinicus]MBB4742744.1 hypothetical protein [Actinoplanes octamycinicus]GIE63044.1 hypothetical protein Aoc01nite_84460 [Actinoplanes octamycinicus]